MRAPAAGFALAVVGGILVGAGHPAAVVLIVVGLVLNAGRPAACTCGGVPGGRCVESSCPHRDAGRPVQPTSPIWSKPTARPEPGTRPLGSPSIGVNVLSDDAPADLGPYVGGPPVASVRSSLIERPDW